MAVTEIVHYVATGDRRHTGHECPDDHHPAQEDAVDRAVAGDWGEVAGDTFGLLYQLSDGRPGR